MKCFFKSCGGKVNLKMIGNKSKENNRRKEGKGEKNIANSAKHCCQRGNNMFSRRRPMEVLLRIKTHTRGGFWNRTFGTFFTQHPKGDQTPNVSLKAIKIFLKSVHLFLALSAFFLLGGTKPGGFIF